jgi:hypothetical protein
MLILVLAANTSFADFPRLASFHAGDNFMPKQLTKRGHRLVFSNGIIALSIAAIVLVIATRAKVSLLIPLYAIGVFTSFTLSQAGMASTTSAKERPARQAAGLSIPATSWSPRSSVAVPPGAPAEPACLPALRSRDSHQPTPSR